MYGLTDKRLDSLLAIWKDWMHQKQGPIGYSARAHIGSSTSSKDLDEMCDEMEIKQACAVDAEIEGLPRNERISIYDRHLAAVWTLREPMAEVYARAREMLRRGLQKRGIE